jgi:hypothetical protein
VEPIVIDNFDYISWSMEITETQKEGKEMEFYD